MLGQLIRKEIMDQIFSLRFLILSIVGALVIWLSLYSGYIYYQARVEDYRLAQTATKERIRQIMVADDNYELFLVAYDIHKPPTPLSILVRGLDPILGRLGNLGHSTRKTARLKWSPAEVDPDLRVFLSLDLGLIVQVVLSLFVLLFTYDAICGEKEAGTLPLIASFSVSRHHLLLGKFLGALIPILTSFGLPLVFGVAVVLLAPNVQFTDQELVRLGLILAAFGFYVTAFVCVGLLASCMAHRVATSFVLLLAFWVVTVMILPRLSLIVAEGIRPAPSIYELKAEKQAVQAAIWEKWRGIRSRWRQEHSGQEWRRTPEGREAYYLFNQEGASSGRFQKFA